MVYDLSKAASTLSENFRGPVASLIAEPNPWSAWMANFEVERLSWMRLAAMVLREVPIALVANRLAAAFTIREAMEANALLDLFEDNDQYEGRAVDWAFWLQQWTPPNGFSPLIDIVRDLDNDLFALYGAELQVSMGWQEDGMVTAQALLWFLLSAIQGWAERGEGFEEVKPGARWILDLHRGERAKVDPIAALLAYSYDRFKTDGYAPTVLLPAVLTIEQPWMVRGVKPRQEE